ncbi:MAG: hypothetical protein RBR40_03000 [Tenuifilaceae bacterium]|nr:hypothetical protein [Tenuifilaceae bacterium]
MKILLFTTSLLSDKDSSWLLLKKMIKQLNEHEITIYSANYLRKKNNKYENYHIIHNTLTLNTPLIAKSINKIWKKLNFYIALFYSRKLSRKIHQIVVKRSIDKIWIYNGMLTVLTLTELLEKITIPYHVSIFDDLLNNKNYKAYEKSLNNEFIKIIKNSTSLDVVVPEQKDYYIERGILQPSHQVGISYGGYFKDSSNVNLEIQSNVTKICLTGNIFGIESFIIFCSSVEKTCVKKGIKIHIYTNNNPLTLQTIKKSLIKFTNFVTIMPFVPEEKIVSTIAQYDLAYIQVPFSKEDKHKAITSFPSKTHNYLSSSVPILLHSPDYAAVSQFLKTNGLCYSINTIDPEEILLKFEQLLCLDTRKAIHKKIVAFNNKPNNNLHFNNLMKIIGA